MKAARPLRARPCAAAPKKGAGAPAPRRAAPAPSKPPPPPKPLDARAAADAVLAADASLKASLARFPPPTAPALAAARSAVDAAEAALLEAAGGDAGQAALARVAACADAAVRAAEPLRAALPTTPPATDDGPELLAARLAVATADELVRLARTAVAEAGGRPRRARTWTRRRGDSDAPRATRPPSLPPLSSRNALSLTSQRAVHPLHAPSPPPRLGRPLGRRLGVLAAAVSLGQHLRE